MKKTLLILLLVFIFGLGMRVYGVAEYDLTIIESVILDMARLDKPGLTEDIKWVYSHFFLFQDPLGEPLGEISSRIYHRFFDGAVLAVRLNSIIAGSLMVFLLYGLFRLVLRDKMVSMFTAAAAHFSFVLVYFSRHAFQQLPMTFFFLLFVFLSVLLLRYPERVFRHRRGFAAAAAGSLLIGFLFHPLMIFAAVASGLYVFVYWLVHRRSGDPNLASIRKLFLTVLLLFFIGLAFVFPRGGLGIGVDYPNKVSFLFGNTEFDQGFASLARTYFLDRLSNFAVKMGEIWDWDGPDSIFRVVPLWTLALAAVGLARTFMVRQKETLFFALCAAVSLVSSAFFFSASTPLVRMYLPFVVFVYFLFGLGFAYLAEVLRFRFTPAFKVAASVLVAMEALFSLNSVFWDSPRYFRVESEIYDLSSRLEMKRAIGILDTLEISGPIGVDTIDKGPGYHLRDRDYDREFVSDSELMERKVLPPVYFSRYVHLKEEPLRKLISENYTEPSPGFYVIDNHTGIQ